MKEEALKLADSYEARANFINEHHEKSGKSRMSTTNQATIKRHIKTADTIRRLVEELDKQGEPVAWSCWNEDMVDLPAIILFTEPDKYEWQSIKPLYTTPQTKPLSDEEMKELINNFPIIFSPQDLLTFGRAIEERHGIK